MWRISRARARWVVPVAVVGTLAMGGVAFATIPDSGQAIHGCYKKSGGSLRVIDSSVTNCDKAETALNWNLSGPPGVNGTNGAPGISGYEMVVKEQSETAAGFFGSVSVTCPLGKKVLGGGAIATTTGGGVQDGYKVT